MIHTIVDKASMAMHHFEERNVEEIARWEASYDYDNGTKTIEFTCKDGSIHIFVLKIKK